MAGIARAHFAPEKWEDLDVVAYEVIKPVLKPSAQMKWLEDHGVITIVHRTVKSVTNELLSEILLDWRQNYKYEVDGVIVANDKIYPRQRKNPKHAFAFKMVLSDQAAEAKVVDVLWTPSKDGYLKPVVQIEKVRLRGAVPPVLARLTDNGRDGCVVHGRPRRNDLVEQLAPEPARGAVAGLPAVDLAGIIRGTAAQEEAAVPLEPAARIVRATDVRCSCT